MAYLLSNICNKNYWNRTTVVEIIIVVGWFYCIKNVSTESLTEGKSKRPGLKTGLAALLETIIAAQLTQFYVCM